MRFPRGLFLLGLLLAAVAMASAGTNFGPATSSSPEQDEQQPAVQPKAGNKSSPEKKTGKTSRPKDTIKILDISATPAPTVKTTGAPPPQKTKVLPSKQVEKFLKKNQPKEDPRKKTAEQAYQKAVRFEQSGKYKKAEEAYNKSNEIFPGYRGGEVYDRLEGYTSLILAEEKLGGTKNKQDRAEAYLYLANACLEKSRAHFKQITAIKERVEKGLAVQDQVAQAQALGELWKKRAHSAAATALKYSPRWPKAQELLGAIIESGTGDALSYYKNIANFDPNNPKMLIKQAVLLMEASRFREAQKILQQALRLEPTLPDALYFSGVCYQEVGELVNAQVVFQRTLECEPRYVKARFKLGEIYFGRRLWDEAIAQFSEAEKQNPEPFAPLYYLRGCCFLEKTQFDSAEQDFKSSLRWNGPEDLCHFKLGMVQFSKGKYKEGFEELEGALRANDKLHEAHERMAYFRLNCSIDELRDYTKALVHALKAVELAGNNCPEYFGTLAEAHFANDDPQSALETIEKGLKLRGIDKKYFEALKRKYKAFLTEK